MALTPDNVKQALLDHVGYVDRGYRIDWESVAYDFEKTQILVIDDQGYVAVVADSKFGGEGDFASDCYIVFRVHNSNEEKFFRISGWYQSYEGTDWDDSLHEVVAQPVQVVEWVNV